jgi:hypothetical protein
MHRIFLNKGGFMSAHSRQVIEEFYKLCNWAYETWLNHMELFDCNPKEVELKKSFANDALNRLSIISQEYSLHQIAKLHDSAIVSGNVTLGIDYIVKYGGWQQPVLTKLEELQKDLNIFADKLRSARNKILSHNDLVTILNGAVLGEFPNGEDERYFETLQEFANVVYSEVIGGPAPFNDLVKNDVAGLLVCLEPTKEH